MKYTIGCDPEGFVFNKDTQRYISAHDLIPGTKVVPHSLKHGAVQRDGVAAEFNINPALSLDEFSRNIFETYNELLRMIRSKSTGYDLRFEPTVVFDQGYFAKNVPPHAKELGCDPDYDAYQLAPNKKPMTKKPFRTGAGHIHVGWASAMSPIPQDKEHFTKCAEIVKQLDVALYIPSLLWDDDDKRRSLYGRLGSFRPKPYGVEYRPLSNKWVPNPRLHKFIFNTVQLAMVNYDRGVLYQDLPDENELIRAIRKGIKPSREEILEAYWEMSTGGLIEYLPKALTTSA